MAVMETVAARVCTRCRKPKPLTTEHFSTKGISYAGKQLWHNVCRPCRSEARAESRERKLVRDRERQRQVRATEEGRQASIEAIRRWRRRLQADPERNAARLAARRERERKKRNGQLQEQPQPQVQVAVEVEVPVELQVEVPWSSSSSAPKPLPSRQLGLKIQELIDRADAMCAVNDPLSRAKGNGTMKDVCARLGLFERQLLAWKNGEQPTVGFDKADLIMQNAGWFWWDVWTEETVRTAVLTVRLRKLTKGGRWSKVMATVTYGDPEFRPDRELLARIEHDFTCCGCPECEKRGVRTLPEAELAAA